MQLVAFDGKVTPPITDGSRLLASVSKLIESCRKHEIPIVYLQTSAAAGRPYAMDVHGWEIHPQISPDDEDHVVTKRNASGFSGTDLHHVLKSLGVDTVLVCGIWSEHCVAKTCIDAIRSGYRVVVIGDGHGTVASNVEEARRTACQQNRRLKEAGASICTVSELSVPAWQQRTVTTMPHRAPQAEPESRLHQPHDNPEILHINDRRTS